MKTELGWKVYQMKTVSLLKKEDMKVRAFALG